MPKIPHLTPQELKELASAQVSALIVAEVGRARARIAELKRVYPSASNMELSERLADSKKSIAGTSGAISGIFGLVSVPFDMVLIAYLQLAVMVDVACLYGVNLKDQKAQDELVNLLQYANGVDPVVRASPRVLGHLAFILFKHGGLLRIGRAFPLVASPVTAYLNNRAISRACREAIVFYGKEAPRPEDAKQQ